MRHLDEALAQLQLDPAKVTIVSDIGCIGILDSLFATPHTFHTTHGRSTAFATGIELADAILNDSKMKTIVVIGDGGSMIGLLHIINAAQMNVDVTVLVANNMLFGMTGGQNSNFSPLDFVTATTPAGNIVPPLDICSIVKSCGAEFVARTTATDKKMTNIIAEAIQHPGFALVEIMELCTEYAIGKNIIDGKSLQRATDEHGNIIKDAFKRKEFAALYCEKVLEGVRKKEKNDSLTPHHLPLLLGTKRIVLAGTAGEKVQLASYLAMRAAIISGLHATQKNDNPVTQGSGFSLSELCLSSEKIFYTGIDEPDVVLITSVDGLKEVRANGTLARASARTTLLVEHSLPDIVTQGNVIRMPLRTLCTPQRAAVSGIAAVLIAQTIISTDALYETIQHHVGEKISLYKNDIEKILSSVKQ